jgi:hypothetical protein
VLSLCRTLGSAKWGAALGVLLVDTDLLTPFAAAFPRQWADFCARLATEPSLHFMTELVGALSQLPEAALEQGPCGHAAAAAAAAAGGPVVSAAAAGPT